MRISWLSAEEIAAARRALKAGGASWDDHFEGTPTVSGEGTLAARDTFASPAEPPGLEHFDWAGITEHVARAERVSEVVREQGLAAAMARFSGSGVAIEEATLAAAAHLDDALDLDQVVGVLRCDIDTYVFYAPFLELMLSLGRGDLHRTVRTYEEFVEAYASALSRVPHGAVRVGAVRDGLADVYVSAGMIEQAEELFERRHEEDRDDVAVALSASRAFLAAGSISHAVRWLGVGAGRAQALGREELATRLRQKQDAVRKRLS
jgi:tetratricopeptide (TPR) repeat protein